MICNAVFISNFLPSHQFQARIFIAATLKLPHELHSHSKCIEIPRKSIFLPIARSTVTNSDNPHPYHATSQTPITEPLICNMDQISK